MSEITKIVEKIVEKSLEKPQKNQILHLLFFSKNQNYTEVKKKTRTKQKKPLQNFPVLYEWKKMHQPCMNETKYLLVSKLVDSHTTHWSS